MGAVVPDEVPLERVDAVREVALATCLAEAREDVDSRPHAHRDGRRDRRRSDPGRDEPRSPAQEPGRLDDDRRQREVRRRIGEEDVVRIRPARRERGGDEDEESREDDEHRGPHARPKRGEREEHRYGTGGAQAERR